MLKSYEQPGNTKGGSITVPLTSCLTGLESAVGKLACPIKKKESNNNFTNIAGGMICVLCLAY
jgi:hypothetical protein